MLPKPSFCRFLGLVLMLTLISCPGIVHARSIADVPNPRTAGGGWISDPLNQIERADRVTISEICDELTSGCGSQMNVVVIEQTDGRTPKKFAIDLFNTWRIGDARSDIGVLFLVVVDAHQMEVQVGRGLENRLTRSFIESMLKQDVVPLFRSNRMSQGIVNGTRRLADQVRGILTGSIEVSQTRQRWDDAQVPSYHPTPPIHYDSSDSHGVLVMVLLGILLIVLVRALYSETHCPRCGEATVRSNVIIQQASYQSPGMGRTSIQCRQCSYGSVQDYVIPQYVYSTTTSSNPTFGDFTAGGGGSSYDGGGSSYGAGGSSYDGGGSSCGGGGGDGGGSCSGNGGGGASW
jgi:uncharacterized membrane protein YgcG